MLNVPTRAQSLSIVPTACQTFLSYCPTLGPKPLSILPTGDQASLYVSRSSRGSKVPVQFSNRVSSFAVNCSNIGFPTECQASLLTAPTSD
jgi:hypothetical protein